MSNILLVEPDAVLARTYTQALHHAGYSVTCAISAQGALHAAEAETPCLVILELQLPVHNGVAFLHEFRSYSEWESVPIVVISYLSLASLSHIKEVLVQDFGVCACLHKPRTSLQQLLKVVREHALTA